MLNCMLVQVLQISFINVAISRFFNTNRANLPKTDIGTSMIVLKRYCGSLCIILQMLKQIEILHNLYNKTLSSLSKDYSSNHKRPTEKFHWNITAIFFHIQLERKHLQLTTSEHLSSRRRRNNKKSVSLSLFLLRYQHGTLLFSCFKTFVGSDVFVMLSIDYHCYSLFISSVNFLSLNKFDRQFCVWFIKLRTKC